MKYGVLVERFGVPDITVDELMTENPVTVTKNTMIRELVSLFKEHDFHAFPVVEDEELKGVVTKTDLVNEIDENGLEEFMEKEVGEICSENLITVKHDANVMDATDLLIKQGHRFVPIVDENELVGVLSYNDIAKRLMKTVPTK
ncbi:hypothetical protein C9439_06990 [archaeon SCG-AAA382B04]|nr:hypothetical protein C9439_06990 [archaeon SCG-AAA382B04]